MPVSDPTFAVSLVFTRIRLSENQGSHAPYKSQGRGNDHSSLMASSGVDGERPAGRRSDRGQNRQTVIGGIRVEGVEELLDLAVSLA